ncbi:hypothetical protein AB0D54_37985 [Streptomyces xanthophaeus]|uniref:hypothetical protein n=1 Tax=Streptomyces xanthophaeus TaxID=67385 RepID=UPI00341673BF
MSTPRRTLGAGPTTSTRTTNTARLLPAERAEEHNEDKDHDEHQDVPAARGRRTLGSGPRG